MEFPSGTRTGAYLIGEELRKRGGSRRSVSPLLLVDYCATFWTWETSAYVQGKLARGQRIGKEYVRNNSLFVEKYIRPAFTVLQLSAMRPYMIEDFTMRLKSGTGLSHSAINGITSALVVPLHEAARLGLIDSDPAAGVRKLGNNAHEKGIPSANEVRALVALPSLDPRVRGAIFLGAACAMRLGEVLALRADAIRDETLTIAQSWSKVEGLKGTKTGRIRVVPLPQMVRESLLSLDASNPHGRGLFLFYGLKPNVPMDSRAVENLFYSALEQIGIDEDTRKERNLTFHSLRHWSNATLRGAVADKTLRLLTGHSSSAMTDRYDHATAADLADLRDAQEAKILPFLQVSGQ
jgi:integrase